LHQQNPIAVDGDPAHAYDGALWEFTAVHRFSGHGEASKKRSTDYTDYTD
jgi:hypothetical protein